MEIKAKCKLDYDACKALAHLNIFRKANPKKGFKVWIIFTVIIALVNLGSILIFHDTEFLELLFWVIVLFLLQCFIYFVIPKISYRNLVKMQEAVHEYIFCDTVLKISTKSKEYNGEAEIEYSLFVKVYETTKYLFLFQTNNHVFIIDNDTIEGGTVEDIRNKLTTYVKDKYILCKY